ncbi:tRNA lysidine(34) synthetase TilS [Sphingomonas sp. KR1UV-12]|uniref:tRNA(Ile)-lysidine synthase n=1 Tax=Sphingomonas aurea TaxID=3063994 RepID=A0ABT9EJ03_9SPHN|nr:tRNA lysidine(34) synthetase TilS [Sphingomonas sp. KR1UV-12]MDP1026788.1 tRNA lysidine(34) synthetase TilS [Sphingomonas sp. KR1UV-12]
MAVPPPGASDPLIPAALAARFAAGVARAVQSTPEARYSSAGWGLAGDGAPAQEAPLARLALAISGGPDSMAMLALATAAFPGRVIAATFDHGLRPASATEAAMVADWCASRAISHATLRPDQPLPASNVQAAARSARYAALGRWAADGGAPLLATAHHADDQAETFLMRANRGSGPTGLAGIRRARPLCDGVTLIRPLLDWRRAELGQVAAHLPVVQDPSNADRHYTRVRARHWLAANPELDPAQLARAADHVADIAADLDELADWAWQTRQGPDGLDVAGLPRALRRLLARRGIAVLRAEEGIAAPAFGPASNVEPLLDALGAGCRATQGGVLVTPRGANWRFAVAPTRRNG